MTVAVLKVGNSESVCVGAFTEYDMFWPKLDIIPLQEMLPGAQVLA